jgi:hypothetical protein
LGQLLVKKSPVTFLLWLSLKGKGMDLYSYVLVHDKGFAPNPFYGYCTLACCKPEIRRHARIGDWVVGNGSVKKRPHNPGEHKLIYAMEVTEKMSFWDYSKDERFKEKIPCKGLKEERGDNIYYKENGKKMQRASYHTEENINTDLRVENVLISGRFVYLGENAVEFPPGFRELICDRRGHIPFGYNEHKNLIEGFVGWLKSKYDFKRLGDPYFFEHKEGLSLEPCR